MCLLGSCKICHFTFEKCEFSRSHYLGRKHKLRMSKVLELPEYALNNESNSTEPPLKKAKTSENSGDEEEFHEIWIKKFDQPIPKEILSKCQIMVCQICGVVSKSIIDARIHYLSITHMKQITKCLQDIEASKPGSSVSNQIPSNLKPTPSNVESTTMFDSSTSQVSRISNQILHYKSQISNQVIETSKPVSKFSKQIPSNIKPTPTNVESTTKLSQASGASDQNLLANKNQISNQENLDDQKIQNAEKEFHAIWINKFSSPIPTEIMSKCQIMKCQICDVSSNTNTEARIHYLGKKHFEETSKALQIHAEKEFHEKWKTKFDQPIPAEIMSKCRIMYCQICNVSSNNRTDAKIHYLGKKHFDETTKCLQIHAEKEFHQIWNKKFSVPVPPEIMSKCQILKCQICDVTSGSITDARIHYLGKKHFEEISKCLKIPANSKQALTVSSQSPSTSKSIPSNKIPNTSQNSTTSSAGDYKAVSNFLSTVHLAHFEND